MFAKTQLAIVGALSCCTMFCVGFASWQISYPTEPKTVSSTIVTDDIIVSNNFIYLDTDQKGDVDENGQYLGYTQLRYNENGFKTNGGNKMTIYFEMDLEKCKAFFINDDSLKTQISIGYSIRPVSPQINLFTYCNAELDYGGTIESGVGSAEDCSFICSYNFNNLLSKYRSGEIDESVARFSITVTCQYSSGTNFRAAVYSLLSQENFSFTISASITGV